MSVCCLGLRLFWTCERATSSALARGVSAPPSASARGGARQREMKRASTVS